jgi:hypothetical protein
VPGKYGNPQLRASIELFGGSLRQVHRMTSQAFKSIVKIGAIAAQPPDIIVVQAGDQSQGDDLVLVEHAVSMMG